MSRGRTSTEESSLSSREASTSWSEQDQKNELVKMLFRLETHEVVLRDFSCAYSGTILLHGRLYVLQRTLCFYSNIFGHETRKIVPISSLTSILKRSTLGIIPTAIEIEVADKDNVVFASFFGSSSRNECYELISKLHMNLGPSIPSSNRNSNKDRKSSSSSGHRRRPSAGGSDGSSSGSIASGHSSNSSGTLNPPIIKPPKTKLPPTTKTTRTTRTSSQRTRTRAHSESSTTSNNNNNNHNNNNNNDPFSQPPPRHRQRHPSPSLTSGPVDITKLIKTAHTELIRATLPVSVKGFYAMFCEDSTREFMKLYHDKRGDSEFQCTKWKDTELGSTREISIRAPVTGAPMMAPDSTRVFKTQRKQWHGMGNDQVLVFDTSQSMSDIPYGDYFTIEERWIVRPMSDGEWKGCEFIATIELKFCKYTMFKSVIVSRAKKDIKESNDLWVTMCTEHLQTSNDAREPIGVLGEAGSRRKAGGENSSGETMSTPDRKNRGKTNSHRNKNNGRSSKPNEKRSSGGGANVVLVYIWGLVIFAMLAYLCKETMYLRKQVDGLALSCGAGTGTGAGTGAGKTGTGDTDAISREKVDL